MRRLLAVLLIIALPFVSGCWGRREIDELALVQVVGIDRGPDGGIMLSAQVLRLGMAASVGGTSGVEAEPMVWSASADTVAEAAHLFTERSTRRPFYGYVRAIAVGEELARDGLRPHLDFVGRDDELRRSALLVVARDMTALELIQARPSLDPDLGLALELLSRHTAIASVTNLTTVNNFLRQLSSTGIEPTVAALTRTSALGGGRGGDELAMAGTAVFRDDRLVGYLDRIESRGLLWVTGGVSEGIVVAEANGIPVTYRVLRQMASVQAQLIDGSPRVKTMVTLEAEISDYPGPETFVEPREIERLEGILAGAVKGEVERALLAARMLGVDVFGFGQRFFRGHHTAWQTQLAPGWETLFTELQIETVVRARLRRAGMRARATS